MKFVRKETLQGPSADDCTSITARLITSLSEQSQFTLVNSDGEAAGAGELGLLLHDQGTVCDSYFSYTAADAICVELGFGWATRWTNDSAVMIQSDFDIKIHNVRCKNESWTSCTFRTDHNCEHSEDVFLECRSAEGLFSSWHIRNFFCQFNKFQFRTKLILDILSPCVNTYKIMTKFTRKCRLLIYPGSSSTIG